MRAGLAGAQWGLPWRKAPWHAPIYVKMHPWPRRWSSGCASSSMPQGADGSLPLPAAEGIRVMLAVARLFAHQGEKTLLEPMMRYCACLRERWEELRLDGSVMGQAANLMELLLFLYNVTGKKALLHLMELTRRDAVDWSGLMEHVCLVTPYGKADAAGRNDGRPESRGKRPQRFLHPAVSGYLRACAGTGHPFAGAYGVVFRQRQGSGCRLYGL